MILHQNSNSIGNHNYNSHTYNNAIWQLHFHGNYELIYTVDDITEVTVNGISIILPKDNFILVSPYSAHSLNISKNTTTWIAVFSKDYIADFANQYTFTNFSKFECDKQIKEFLLNHLICKPKPEHYMLTACLYLICEQCLKNSKTLTQNNNIDFIKNVIMYITKNIENNITMKETAHNLNYEYHYFSALFNKYFSMNFKSFINVLRFEQACEILSSETISITQVCNRCGFESIRNFNRIFKVFSGMTPGEYRKQKNKTK